MLRPCGGRKKRGHQNPLPWALSVATEAPMMPAVTLDILGSKILRVVCAAGFIIAGPALAAGVWGFAAPHAVIGKPAAFLILWALASVIFGTMYALAGLELK